MFFFSQPPCTVTWPVCLDGLRRCAPSFLVQILFRLLKRTLRQLRVILFGRRDVVVIAKMMIEGARTVRVCYTIEWGRGCESIAQSHPSKSSRARASSFFEWIEKGKIKINKKCASILLVLLHFPTPCIYADALLPSFKRAAAPPSSIVPKLTCSVLFPFWNAIWISPLDSSHWLATRLLVYYNMILLLMEHVVGLDKVWLSVCPNLFFDIR